MDRDQEVPPHRLRPTSLGVFLLALLSLGVTSHAEALGVDRPLAQSGLGQPLNLLFPVRLSAGETLSSDCVLAEVFSGDSRIAPSQLRVQLEGSSEASVRGVRLRSSVAIDEPIISVNLSVGCPPRLVRQYSALIDPPNPQNQPQSNEGAVASPRNYSPALRAALASAGAQSAALLGESSPAEPVAAKTKMARESKEPEQVKQVKKVKQAKQNKNADTSAAAKPVDVDGAALQPKHASDKTKASATAAASRAASKPASVPRLRLDAPEDLPVASGLAGAVGLGAGDPDAMLRLQKLEEGLSQLRRDKQGTEARVLALRSELASSPSASNWTALNLGLLLAAASLGAFSAYLWFSRRRERSLREEAWWQQAGVDTSDAASSVPADSPLVAKAQAPAVQSPAKSAPALAASVALFPDEQTMVLPHIFAAEDSPDLAPGGSLQQGDEGQNQDAFSLGRGLSSAAEPAEVRASGFGGLEPLSIQLLDEDEKKDQGLEWPGPADSEPVPLQPRPAAVSVNKPADAAHVSVEELIDLEQQVDFFLVLGQTEAAVELLLVHIHTETASALPYLKLMEIYQRQGNRAGFNDVAERFARRFHGLPPAWGQDMRQGRHLEAYAEVMSLLQLGWANSHGSMAMLQSLLAKGDEQSIGFELPAYLDLLLLYSVARDLSEHEVRSESVDLFLPLDAPPEGEAGMDLMATMVWQAPDQAQVQDAGVDILLDEAPLIHKV